MTEDRRAYLNDPPDKLLRDLFGDDPQPPPGWSPPRLTPDDLADMNATHCHVPDFVFTRAGIPEWYVREHYPEIVIIKPYDPTQEDE